MKFTSGDVRHKEDALCKQFVWWLHTRIWVWTQENFTGEKQELTKWKVAENSKQSLSDFRACCLNHSPNYQRHPITSFITSFADFCFINLWQALLHFSSLLSQSQPYSYGCQPLLDAISPYLQPPAFSRALGSMSLLSLNTFSGSQLPPTMATKLWFKDIYVR